MLSYKGKVYTSGPVWANDGKLWNNWAQCILWYLKVGILRYNDADGNENVKKTKGLISKTTTLHVHHPFLYISFLFLHDFDVKMPISRFMEDVNKQRRNFISLPELEYGHLKFSFRVGVIAIKTETTQIHFLSNVLVVAPSLDLKVPSDCTCRCW